MNTEIQGWKGQELSEKATQALANLKEGMPLILRAKAVNSRLEDVPKIQLEVAEKIPGFGSNRTFASVMNLGHDPNFSSGAQRVWPTIPAKVGKEVFGIEVTPEDGVVDVLKPLNDFFPGEEYRIQYTEITEDQLSDSNKQYIDNYLKRRGPDGDYFYAKSNGLRVASLKQLVKHTEANPVTPTFIEGEYRSTAVTSDFGNSPAISSDVAQGVK